jgi:acetyltransferase-like isoleucine patch superfamily enzyme
LNTIFLSALGAPMFGLSPGGNERGGRTRAACAHKIRCRLTQRKSLLWRQGKGGSLKGQNVTERIDNVPRAVFDDQLSSRLKYQRLIVGQDGWGPLLRYELINMLAKGMPGALGLALRLRLYPFLLGHCGRNVFFGSHVTLRHPHKIRIGDNVVIDDGCVIDAKGTSNEGITIGNGVFIGRHTAIHTKDGNILLEDGVNISSFCTVFSASRVRIGANTLIAGYSYIVGGGHDSDRTDVDIVDQPRSSQGIVIGPGGWIGTGVAVLDGVTLGRGVIVGANAVVRSDLPDLAVAAGSPARVVRTRQVQPSNHAREMSPTPSTPLS